MHYDLKQSARMIAAAGVLATTASCTYFAPTGSDITPASVAAKINGNEVPAHYSLGQSMAYARELREAYQDKIDEQFLIKNLADLAFIPIAGAAAFYGISSSHTDVVLGLTIAGTATFLAGERFSNSTDQLIYASGILSINCVLSSFESQRIAYRYRSILMELVGGPSFTSDGKPSLEDGKLLSQIAELKVALAALPEGVPKLVADARALIQTAQVLRDTTGRKALGQIDSAGDQMIVAVSNVKAQVAQALVNNTIDAGRFRDAVESAFRSSITSIPKTDDQPSAEKERSEEELNILASPKPDVSQVRQKMAALEKSARAVREIAELVSAPPSIESLKRCAVDVDAQGLTLAVSRPGPIIIPLKANETGKLDEDVVVSFTISGGRQPYKAAWAGVVPVDNLGVPTITTSGLLSTKLEKDLAQGVYELEVLDSSKRSAPIVVKIQIGAANPPSDT